MFICRCCLFYDFETLAHIMLISLCFFKLQRITNYVFSSNNCLREASVIFSFDGGIKWYISNYSRLIEYWPKNFKNKHLLGVPIVVQRKQIQPLLMKIQVQSLASLSGLEIWRCCDVEVADMAQIPLCCGCVVGWQLQLWFNP